MKQEELNKMLAIDAFTAISFYSKLKEIDMPEKKQNKSRDFVCRNSGLWH